MAALLAVLGVASVGQAHDQLPGAAPEGPVLLRGGDLYTIASGVLPATDLLFEGGVIRRIGRGLDTPPGTEVIDVSGSRVYPGLVAAHTTLGLIEIGAVRATNDQTEVGSITPEVASHVAYNPDSELVPTVRSHGITTAQVVPLGSLVRGRSFVTHLDGWTKEDAAVTLVDGLQVRWPEAAVRYGSSVSEKPDAQRERLALERTRLRRAFDDARAYLEARRSDPRRPLDLRWEAMRGVLSGDEPVFLAADDYRQIVEALDFAAEHGLRPVLVGGQDAWQLVDRLVRQDVPVIVGSVTALPLREDEPYDLTFRVPALLHAAGVRFCLAHTSSNSWDVRNLPLLAGMAAAHGLPREAALRAITLSAAEILGIADREGSLEPGKRATLFVSRGDVMDTLGQGVSLMFIEGRRVDLEDRHKTLYRKYRAKPHGNGPP
jgi:imidazolonepropionase-like amidohydrolase